MSKKFTCVRRGSKLVWNRGISLQPRLPTPTPSPPPPTAEPAVTTSVSVADNYVNQTSPLTECQLRERTPAPGLSGIGFPTRHVLPTTGVVKIAVIPVDFANAVGSGSPGLFLADDLTHIREWGEYFSRGHMSYEPVLASTSWVRAPRGADWYTCVRCHKGATEEKQPQSAAIQELVNLVDPTFDFTDVSFVYFLFPTEAEVNFGTALNVHQLTLSTGEGPQTVAVYGEMGGTSNREKIWDHLIHEILHYQGFVGHFPLNGSMLGIMMNQWGDSKAITAWEGFIAGWFTESELLCIDVTAMTRELYVTLNPIDAFADGPESILLRLSDEELLVIERRTNGPFTQFVPRQTGTSDRNGVVNADAFTMYVVNVNMPIYRDDSNPNADALNFSSYLRENGAISLQTSMTINGVTIRRVTSSQVAISRA